MPLYDYRCEACGGVDTLVLGFDEVEAGVPSPIDHHCGACGVSRVHVYRIVAPAIGAVHGAGLSPGRRSQ